VKQILQVNKQFNELGEKIAKFSESYFSGEKLVKTAEECNLSKDKYDTKSLMLEPTKKAGKELYKLTLTKEDYMLFGSRAVAECALEQLKHKDKVRIEEIHELEVPSEKDASRVMDEFSNDKKRIEEIKKEVEKLEQEIDELVYKLYGITEAEKKIIEESLK
jgi:cell division septum initiation protein DivIVA